MKIEIIDASKSKMSWGRLVLYSFAQGIAFALIITSLALIYAYFFISPHIR